MGQLSGGNQQRALFARRMDQEVKVLLLDEPTRGVDIGAKREIYDIVFDLAKTGVGILVVSSELAEILGVSDRILVMSDGRIVGEAARGESDPEALLKLALPGVAAGR
jgi:L-arabinose transport system ATP-binding protein